MSSAESQLKSCEAKRFEYHLIISLWNKKKPAELDPQKVLAFLKKSYLGQGHSFEDVCVGSPQLGNNLIVGIYGKYLKFDAIEGLATKVSDKFFCDITMTMTDDDGCAKGLFIEGYKPKEK